MPPVEDPPIPLAIAEAAARMLVDSLRGSGVLKIEVAGSIRRRRPFVHDIDLVLLVDGNPSTDARLSHAMEQWNTVAPPRPTLKVLRGRKIKRVWTAMGVGGDVIPRLQFDVYLTDNSNHWSTLLLVRTGSKAHNIKLTTRAQRKGWKLHADGQGLVDERGRVIAFDSEEEILRLLDCDHHDPTTREA